LASTNRALSKAQMPVVRERLTINKAARLGNRGITPPSFHLLLKRLENHNPLSEKVFSEVDMNCISKIDRNHLELRGLLESILHDALCYRPVITEI
jgi:hypothetical protein